MVAPVSGETVPAVELQPGQTVYIPFFREWFTLDADPRTHVRSANIVVLVFAGLSQPEYRAANHPMRVR